MVIRPFTVADYPVLSRIASALRPDAPWTEAQLHRADRTQAGHLKTGGFLAEQDRALGFVRYTQYADYHQPEKVVLFGGVLPEFWGQGAGRGLLAALERHLPTVGVSGLQVQVSSADPATLAFLVQARFEETWRRLPYRLDVRRLGTHALEAALETLTAKLERQNIRVKTYPKLSGDTARDEKLRALSWRLERDVPYGEPTVELDLEAFRRERLAPEAVLKDAFYIAVKGERYLGMSSLWNYGAYLETEFTGVLSAYRGRGVAALMKLLGIRYARAHGFPKIRTTNDAGNDAMRRLNEQLGFKAQPALLRLEKRLGGSGYAKAMMPEKMTPANITTGPLPYLLYTPDAEPAETDVPLVLFLHGAGERGNDLERVKAHGLPKVLVARNPFPEPAFVVAPQCSANSWWPLELAALEALLDEVQAQHPIDTARVYLTGLSMGGYGAWGLALKNPARFAALVPVCGGGIPPLAHKLKELPIWAFHGADDAVVPLAASESMVDAVRKTDGQVRFTVYPGVGHDSWTRAYDESELYPWMFVQRRKG